MPTKEHCFLVEIQLIALDILLFIKAILCLWKVIYLVIKILFINFHN